MSAAKWLCLTLIILATGCARPDPDPAVVSAHTHKTLGPDDVKPIVTCATGSSSAGCGSSR